MKDTTDQIPQEADKERATRALEALQIYAAKNPIIQAYSKTEIETDIAKLQESDQAHHTFTHLMMAHLKELDFVYNHNRFRFKTESTHINTQSLMYMMDMFFTWIDKTTNQSLIPSETEEPEEKSQQSVQESP